LRLQSIDVNVSAELRWSFYAKQPYGGTGNPAIMIAQAPRRHARFNPIASETPQLKVEEGEGSAARVQITPRDASSYILSMIAELRALAKVSQFAFLTYLLEMGFQEAFRLTGELEKSQGAPEPEPLKDKSTSTF
jgi:hypothetical protein